MTECINGCFGLTDCLPAHRPGMAPLEWEVLEDQHAEFVRCPVHLAVRDVAVHAHRVETEFDGQRDVSSDSGVVGIGQPGAGRQHVGAFQEELLTVDRADPFVPRHLT